MSQTSALLLVVCLSVGGLLAGTAEASSPVHEPPMQQQEITNLHAFAKLYGYVRFFHPSDAASSIDWNRFAIHGARSVLKPTSTEELQTLLESLFSPIAPTLRIYREGEPPPPPPASLNPANAEGLKVVAWQHRGVGLGSPGSYLSQRSNRRAIPANSSKAIGNVMQQLDGKGIRGRKIKLRVAVRAEVAGPGHEGRLWLRVDLPDGKFGFFDNMAARPITSPKWQTYEISGEVAEDALNINFGAILLGQGRIWIDAFEIFTQGPDGAWVELPVPNGGFEESSEGPLQWGFFGADYQSEITIDKPHSGERTLSIFSSETAASSKTASQPLPAPLFEALPAGGETVDRSLGGGLRVSLPIALFSRDGKTLGEPDRASLEALKADLGTINVERFDPEDPGIRLAGITIAWNILQHFYPYFDVVEVDWEAKLDRAAARALGNASRQSFQDTLSWLVAALQDGHTQVSDTTVPRRMSPFPPLASVNNQIVVLVPDEKKVLQRGDILLEVQGRPTEEILRHLEANISGSPQWKKIMALLKIGTDSPGEALQVVVLREGARRSLTLPKSENQQLVEWPYEALQELPQGVRYVNLSKAPMATLQEHMEDLAQAPGVVFDLRGYPAGNHKLLRHLTSEPINSAHFRVPQTLYPDQVGSAGFFEAQWSLQPKAPRFRGCIAFLTDARAVSYSETILAMVKHYRLGEIVGQPTAGANGNINVVKLPGGFVFAFTGFQTLQQDGGQHHLIGIPPTVPVERTLQGIRDGRDELLDRALEVIESCRHSKMEVSG